MELEDKVTIEFQVGHLKALETLLNADIEMCFDKGFSFGLQKEILKMIEDKLENL